MLGQHGAPRTYRLIHDRFSIRLGGPGLRVELPQACLFHLGPILAPFSDSLQGEVETLHSASLAISRIRASVSSNGAFIAESCFRKSSTCGRDRMAASSLGLEPPM